jgi:uncharacterized repeat protein (TIGR01451 family)
MKITKQTLLMSLGIFGAMVASIVVIYLVRGGNNTLPENTPDEMVSKVSPTAAPIFQIAGNVCALTFDIPCAPGISCTSKKAYQNVATNVAGSYTLTSEIASGATVSRDQILVYQLNYANTGNTTIPSAAFTDTIPTSVDFVDSQAACSFASSTRVVTCTLSNIPAGATGSVAFRVRVKADAASSSFTNTAVLTPSTGTVSDCSIPLTVAGVASPSPSSSAGAPNLDCLYKRAYLDDSRNRAGFYYLETQISDTASLQDGQTIVYSIGMRNHGTASSSDVVMTDTLSSALTFVDADNGCSYDASSRRVTCNVGSLAGGVETTRSIRVRVGVSSSTAIENSAEVFSTNGQRDTCYLRVDASGKVVNQPSPSPVTTLPEAGVFEITAGTLGAGVLFLLVGAVGLLLL